MTCRRSGCTRIPEINPRTGQPYFCCAACRQRENSRALTAARQKGGQSRSAYRERLKQSDWNRVKSQPVVAYAVCPDSWWTDPLCQEDRTVFTQLVNTRLSEMRRSRFGLIEELAYGPDEPPRPVRRKSIGESA